MTLDRPTLLIEIVFSLLFLYMAMRILRELSRPSIKASPRKKAPSHRLKSLV